MREDVHIILQLEEAFYPYSMRGQDLVIQHTIDLLQALRGSGCMQVLMPDRQLEDFELQEPVHELQELTYLGRGLKNQSTGFVGCVIVRFHIQYPGLALRAAIADFIEAQ